MDLHQPGLFDLPLGKNGAIIGIAKILGLLQSSIPHEPFRSRESRECSSRSAVGSQFILKCLLNQHGFCSHYSLKKLSSSKCFALVATQPWTFIPALSEV